MRRARWEDASRLVLSPRHDRRARRGVRERRGRKEDVPGRGRSKRNGATFRRFVGTEACHDLAMPWKASMRLRRVRMDERVAHTRDLHRRLDGPRLSPPLIPLPQRHLLSHPFLRSRSSARHAPFSWTPFSGFNPRVFVRRNRDVHPFKFSRSPFDFSPVFSFQSISFRSDHSFLLVGGLVPFERGEVEGLCRDPHVDRVDVTEPHSRRRGRFTTRAERGRPWRRAK